MGRDGMGLSAQMIYLLWARLPRRMRVLYSVRAKKAHACYMVRAERRTARDLAFCPATCSFPRLICRECQYSYLETRVGFFKHVSVTVIFRGILSRAYRKICILCQGIYPMRREGQLKPRKIAFEREKKKKKGGKKKRDSKGYNIGTS